MKYRWSRPQQGESHVISDMDEIVRVVRTIPTRPAGSPAIPGSMLWEAQVLDTSGPNGVGQWWTGGRSFDLTEARTMAEALLGLARGEHSDLSAAGIV